MEEGLQLSARFVASMLARIYGPSIYDLPRFGGGGPLQYLIGETAGPSPQPWREVALNPQPLPPRAAYTVALSDAYIQEIVQLDRAAVLLGDDVAERAVDRAFRLMAEVDEICPRWPKWPKKWPPPPPPPWERETMLETELFVFGARILAAAGVVDHQRLQEGLSGLGERILGMSMKVG